MKAETVRTIERVVLDHHVETGDALSIPEIAARVSWGETTVRAVVQASERLELTHKYMLVMSEQVPGRVHQRRSVDAYMPTRRWLREEIKTLARFRSMVEHRYG